MMNMEAALSKRLQRFSIIDVGLVKLAYFALGLFVFSVYPAMEQIDWWFYLILAIWCELPLGIHFFSQPGNLMKKTNSYLKTSNPSNHILLSLAMFFLAAVFSKIFNTVINSPYSLLIAIVIFSIKPVRVFLSGK